WRKATTGSTRCWRTPTPAPHADPHASTHAFNAREYPMSVSPYLNFNGRCEEAIEFYKKAVGAKVDSLMRFKEMPNPPPGSVPPGPENKVMHAHLSSADSPVLMSDGRCQGGEQKFDGISLTLTAKSDADAQRVFNALAEGGQVQMPLGKTFFS